MWFLVTERVLVGLAPRALAARGAAAALAALIGATAFTVWNQSVVNEKVYTVSLAVFAIVSWLTVRWCDDPEGRDGRQACSCSSAILHRRSATRTTWRDSSRRRRWSSAVLAAAAARRCCAGSCCSRARARCCSASRRSPSQPIRAAHFPAINEGEPTACTTHFAMSCTFIAVTYDGSWTTSTAGSTASRRSSTGRRRSRAQVGHVVACTSSGSGCATRTDTSPRGLQAMLAAALPGARARRAGGRTGKRDRELLVLRAAHVHAHARARSYYLNFKYGALAGAGARQHACRARCATATTSSCGASRRGACGRRSASCSCGSGSRRCCRHETRSVGRETVELPTRQSWLVTLAGAAARRSSRCSATGHRRRAHGQTRHARLRARPAQLASSRTACSSPPATTTPSRSGTRRKWRACART